MPEEVLEIHPAEQAAPIEPPPPVVEQRCQRCNHTKPLNQFIDGSSLCKNCRIAVRRANSKHNLTKWVIDKIAEKSLYPTRETDWAGRSEVKEAIIVYWKMDAEAAEVVIESAIRQLFDGDDPDTKATRTLMLSRLIAMRNKIMRAIDNPGKKLVYEYTDVDGKRKRKLRKMEVTKGLSATMTNLYLETEAQISRLQGIEKPTAVSQMMGELISMLAKQGNKTTANLDGVEGTSVAHKHRQLTAEQLTTAGRKKLPAPKTNPAEPKGDDEPK